MDGRYGDLEKYILQKLVREDFIYYDDNYSSQYYDYLLNKMSKQHYCLKLYDNKYLTIKKLAELGITIEKFNELKEEIEEYILNSVFVTTDQLLNELKNDICKLFPDETAFINLIKSFDEFKAYKLGNKTIFSIKSDSARNDAVEKMFISLLESNNETSMDVYDLVYLINEKYDFEFTVESFMLEVKNFKIIFYSKETERVYLNNEQYYKEIYE